MLYAFVGPYSTHVSTVPPTVVAKLPVTTAEFGRTWDGAPVKPVAQPAQASAASPATITTAPLTIGRHYSSESMSAHRHQAHLEAPREAVWELMGTPRRYPEWWPRVIEVRGERFEEGDEYAQVTESGRRVIESSFLLERRDNLRGIRMSCQLTGMYADWLLTPAAGGTVVELGMGMNARGVGMRVFDLAGGKLYFRRWATQSLDGLRDAVVLAPPG